MPIKLSKAVARKVLQTVDAGLVKGKGEPVPGHMCVEAAVCYALGLPHGDEPPCVGSAVREFKIRLNDCYWPSCQDRAKGMRELSIAQLGSDTLDQMAFGKLIYLRGVQQLLPFVWRRESEHIENPDRKAEMLKFCEQMEAVTTFEDARNVAKDAYDSACAYASASACDYAYDYASANACAYASASAYSHELLKRTAKVGVDVLKEMKSPGCEWLDLCK